MEDYLRAWRKDALNKHQYDSAIFIADKLLAITKDDKDAFWLAQVHFSTGNYTRAEDFLARHDLITRDTSCRYLAAHCMIKQNKFEEALTLLGQKNPTHLVSVPSNSRRKLQHVYVTTAAGVRKGPSGRIGKDGSFGGGKRRDRMDKSEEREREDPDHIKFEAAMCYLRGLCYAKQNGFDRAKECYKDAVRIDVQCFEAFDQLMRNNLMSPDEEIDFIQSLDFESIVTAAGAVGGDISVAQEAAAFTRMLYTTRLPKYKSIGGYEESTETLSTHYNLANNPDLLLSRADLYYSHCRFTEALQLTTEILANDKHNFSVYPLHLACLHELGRKNDLFLIAHELADHHPDEPCSWLAVGVYYHTINRIAEARRFFSKASMMDPHFGPAWIGFAHTFAAEGEHDQAISAYSTAARLFQGTHLPQLFLGMQNLQLNHITLADEYFKTAFDLCRSDPLLLNEMGVVFYHQGRLPAAIETFVAALKVADEIGSDVTAWISTRANLGHAYRRTGRFYEALDEFNEVLRQGGRDSSVFCAKGLVLLEIGNPLAAIQALHAALRVAPQDPIAHDLLSKALEEHALMERMNQAKARAASQAGKASAYYDTSISNGNGGVEGGMSPEDEFENVLRIRKVGAVAARRGGDGAGGGRGGGSSRGVGNGFVMGQGVLNAQTSFGQADGSNDVVPDVRSGSFRGNGNGRRRAGRDGVLGGGTRRRRGGGSSINA
ncbi:MAG: anaphase promoting complex subunit cdc16 [Watsoniomyces obsoletus]|nr:MAG: anaphase promoting complex subunit cdc16 [Watsoniomyces obsoletus]